MENNTIKDALFEAGLIFNNETVDQATVRLIHDFERIKKDDAEEDAEKKRLKKELEECKLISLQTAKDLCYTMEKLEYWEDLKKELNLE